MIGLHEKRCSSLLARTVVLLCVCDGLWAAQSNNKGAKCVQNRTICLFIVHAFFHVARLLVTDVKTVIL